MSALYPLTSSSRLIVRLGRMSRPPRGSPSWLITFANITATTFLVGDYVCVRVVPTPGGALYWYFVGLWLVLFSIIAAIAIFVCEFPVGIVGLGCAHGRFQGGFCRQSFSPPDEGIQAALLQADVPRKHGPHRPFGLQGAVFDESLDFPRQREPTSLKKSGLPKTA